MLTMEFLRGSPRSMPRARQLITFLIPVLFIAAACGDDDDTSTEANLPKSSTNEVPAVESPPETSSSSDENSPLNIDELEQAAGSEGKVVFYSALGDALNVSLCDAFTAEYDIKCEYTRTSAGDMAARLDAERSGSGVADVALATLGSSWTTASFTETGLFVSLAEALPGYPDELPGVEVDPLFLREDMGTFATDLRPRGVTYNTDLIEQAPTSWEEFADPKYKGRLATPNLETLETYLSFWAVMIDQLGEDLVSRIGENLVITDDAVSALQGVGAGEYLAIFPTSESLMTALAEAGAPVEFLPLEMDGALDAGGQGVGILESAPHPNAARLFAYYLLTPEAAAVFSADAEFTVTSATPEAERPDALGPQVWERETAKLSPETRENIFQVLGLE